jgi:hypothetical protein
VNLIFKAASPFECFPASQDFIRIAPPPRFPDVLVITEGWPVYAQLQIPPAARLATASRIGHSQDLASEPGEGTSGAFQIIAEA